MAGDHDQVVGRRNPLTPTTETKGGDRCPFDPPRCECAIARDDAILLESETIFLLTFAL
jgi:hypothetical protein